ncbi:MAG TPA: polyprenyl synthetase family protein [Oligoflexia bacterium]|nr:polyprenyl synthetase family protein [Oligoflexia bacterium]HMR25653.1 polyprenyl synthetase family protein [Oligoflexia bacterium]
MLDPLIKEILSCSELQAWPDLENILAKRKPGTIALFKIAYESTANTQIEALAIEAAIVCFIINCILIDDVLDKDEKGIWQTYGAGRVANLAAALQARQQTLIHQSSFSDHQKQEVMFHLNQMKLKEARAQELATRSPLDLNQYWDIVHGKSGNVCATAMQLGGLLGGADQSQIEVLYTIGKNLGEVGQISNDLRGAFDESINPDWAMPGCSLPILIALTSQHAQLNALKQHIDSGIHNTTELKKVQDILLESGAVSLCCDHIAQRLELMYEGLCQCTLDNKTHLIKNIGEDIQHAIAWVRDLDIELLKKTTQTLDTLHEKLAALEL